MNNIACKLPKLDGSSFFVVHTVWDDEDIRFSIFDNDGAWTGQFAKKDALEASKTLGLSSEEYMTETRLALSTNNGADKFQYLVIDNHFKWIKLVEKDVVEKVEYGSVELNAGALSIIMDGLIDCLINNNIRLAELVKNTNEEKLKVESDKQQLVQTLHRHISEKQAMEESLYANFLEILNSKKLKLAELQDNKLEKETRASSPTAGCSRADQSKPKVSSPRAKATTWRKTTRPKPVRKANKRIIESDSPDEEEFPFQRTREPMTREAKRKSPPEKCVPLSEPIDEYDGDTEIDEPPDVIKESSADQVARNVDEKTAVAECHTESNEDCNEIPVETSCSNQPLEMTRSQLREFHTQKLLDDLGI